ncbi:hypothetical protein CRG98_002351 [Punica granatum]|uniref:Uncharacterized protein n=1 Tax=Punica granatum TaxID=22663 RepID=A0A2I0L996_PUNGR|nr:hypothetical protein CRG98_002351 [Punica granatum]
MPSRSKGSSQPSPSPVKRWSRSEGRSTVHNLRSSVFLLPGSTRFLPYFLSHFQACPGLGTFGSAHGHLDLLLRSPTSSTPHRAVAGARVPTHFPRTAAAASTRVSQPVTLKPRRRGPRGSVVPREAHGLFPCKEAERSLGPSEAMDFSFRDAKGFSGYVSKFGVE